MIRNIDKWLFSYLWQSVKRMFRKRNTGTTHVIFSLVDHFEPKWVRPGEDVEKERVDAWVRKYPLLAEKHTDSDGHVPKHTFYYPAEEYEKEHLDKLAYICSKGAGEVEIHLHHDGDTDDVMRLTVEEFKDILTGHGLLSQDNEGNIRYGFIHGNWSLCNSRPDGRWCGVNNELSVLNDTGCYADLTMPSAPSDTQTAKINSIYYASDTGRPKAHNTGTDVELGRKQSGDMMLVQGPLALDWKRRKIENGSVTLNNPPSPERIDLWVRQGIGVKNKHNWVFVKVYTHGAQDAHITDKFFGYLDDMFTYLEEKYNDGVQYKLHYVSSREMYNIVKAAEAGESGEPGLYRDYILKTRIKRAGFNDTKTE